MAKNAKHKFQKTIDRWLGTADGDREVLIDEIVTYLEDGDLADYSEVASFVADELLGNDNEGEDA